MGGKIMKEKIMEMVEEELRTDPRTRDSDKFLIWKIMIAFGIHIPYKDFMELPCFESITRCRRKLQETYPGLKANFNVIQARKEKLEIFKQINKPRQISQTF